MLHTCCIADWKPEDERLRLSLLPASEQARLAGLRGERRRLSLAAHAMAREVLAPLLGVSPARVPLARTETGKPFLPERDLYLSLAHAGDTAFCAVDRFPIGVDAERRGRRVPPTLVWRTCLPEEQAWLERLPQAEQPVGFLRLWTLKEAWVKAVGGTLGQVWHVSFRQEAGTWLCSEPGFVCEAADTEGYVVSLVRDVRGMCAE